MVSDKAYLHKGPWPVCTVQSDHGNILTALIVNAHAWRVDAQL